MKTRQLNNSKLQRSKIDLTQKIFAGDSMGQGDQKKVLFPLCRDWAYAIEVDNHADRGTVPREHANHCFKEYYRHQAEIHRKKTLGF